MTASGLAGTALVLREVGDKNLYFLPVSCQVQAMEEYIVSSFVIIQ